MKTGIVLACAAGACVVALEVLAVTHKVKVAPVEFDEQAPQAAVAPEKPIEPELPPVQPPAEVKEKKLDLQLLATLLNGKSSSAFIKDLRANTSRVCRIGSVIQGAKVVNIAKGEVTLLVDGERRRLTMAGLRIGPDEHGSGDLVESVSPDTMVIRKGELAKVRDQVFQELGKLKVRPQYDGKRVGGLRVEGIEDGSILTSAGIRNNDVIREVNDQKIDSYQKGLQVFLKARSRQEIKVNLMRGGEPRQLSFRLE